MRTILVSASLLALVGCGGGSGDYVPVSGRVTMDGTPLPYANVTFQPMAASGGGDTGGYGSSGYTDQDGKYTLRVNSQQLQTDGALVGKHRVQIVTRPRLQEVDPDSKAVSEDGAPPPKAAVPSDFRRVPAKYNDDSTLTFDVPADGTDQANFELSSR